MLPMKSTAVPINPYGTALRSGSRPRGFNFTFGTNPYNATNTGFGGMRGGYDPGMQSYVGMAGLKGCGCGPVSGCSCSGASGLSGMGQNTSLDTVIGNAFSWLGGAVQSSLPASAAVPSGVGSFGALATTLMNYAPYILIGYLAYKVIK